MLGGHGQCCTTSLQHMNRLSRMSLLFRFFDVFLASRGSSFRTYFIFTTAGIWRLYNVSPCIIIVQNIYFLHINRLNKTESAIFVSLMCSLLPENLHSELILSSLQLVLCRVAAVKCLTVHHHSANYIFSGPLESLSSF